MSAVATRAYVPLGCGFSNIQVTIAGSLLTSGETEHGVKNCRRFGASVLSKILASRNWLRYLLGNSDDMSLFAASLFPAKMSLLVSRRSRPLQRVQTATHILRFRRERTQPSCTNHGLDMGRCESSSANRNSCRAFSPDSHVQQTSLPFWE